MMKLALQARGDYPTLLATARYCEANGVEALALPDHYLASKSDITAPAHDALSQVAGLAVETATLELSTLVSPVTFRHPAVTLKSAVTIDEMSGGRFTLGLGAGWFVEEHELFGLPFPDRRFDLLEEALGYTRAGLTGIGFQGTHFELAEFDMHPKPTNLRIVVGGSGPRRTPELAGRFADEFNVYCGPLDEMRERIELARAAASAADRDPAGLLISSAGVVITGTTDSQYRIALEQAADRFAKEPSDLERALRERGNPIGRDATDTMNALSEIGVQRFYLQMFATDGARREDMLTALS